MAGWRAPATDTGYNQGFSPAGGGSGARQGPKGLTGMQGMSDRPEWHPTVRYLLLLVIAELVLMGSMRYLTRHGG